MAGHEEHQQRGVAWLTELLRLAQVSASVLGYTTTEQDEVNCWLEIQASDLTPEQRQILLSDRGQVLDAMQYLANSILNLGQAETERQPYIVELDGYRVRRQAELATIATAAATEARTTGQAVEIRQLSAAERRQVHTLLKDETDISTFSRGKEPDRRLVVQVATAEAIAED